MTFDHRRRLALGLALFALAVSVSMRAQAPAQTTLYTVAYVDVGPSSTAAMTAALARYRDASRAEDGYRGIDLLEQTSRPGRYAVVEAWQDQRTLDAHAAAAHAKAFRDDVQALRQTGYDQRPYKAFGVAPAAGAGDGQTVYVVTHVDIAGQQPDAPGLLRSLAEASRTEAGCLRFDVLQHTMRANHFTIVEVWRTQQALDAHAAAAHTREYRDKVQPMTGSPLDERVYRVVG